MGTIAPPRACVLGPRDQAPVDRLVADPSLLPASRGVVLIEDASARLVILASTADIRRFIRERLGEAAVDSGHRANLRDCAAMVRWVRTGSALESEAVHLQLARELMPDLARSIAERRRAWFVRIDPGAEFPEWTKTDLSSDNGAPARSAASAVARLTRGTEELVGPIADKDAAGRFIEGLVDLFDLCRFQRILVQAPSGQPCAYKEMGRCPAACDGSETMDAYRARVRDAVEFACGQRQSLLDSLEFSVHRSAEALDFEAARSGQRRLDCARSLDRPGFAHMRRVRDFRHVVVLPSVRRMGATVAASGASGIGWIADVVGSVDKGCLADVLATASRWLEDRIDEPPDGDAIGLVARWLVASPRRTRGIRIIPVVPRPPEPGALLRAVRAVAGAEADSTDEDKESVLESM